jgi:hypothetical protein
VITASALERTLACPPSHVLPHARSSSVHAERGTAIHAFLAAASVDREAALEACTEDVRPICEAIDLAALPVHLLPEAAYAYHWSTGAARFLGSNIGRDYSGVRPDEAAGTADVVGVDPEARRGFVADYKTGHGDVTPAARNAQLRFLALCVARVHGLDVVVVEIIRIRPDGRPWRDRATLDVLDLAQFAGELAALPRRIHEAAEDFVHGRSLEVHEGPWCRYCPAFASCPAKARLAVQVAEGRVLAEAEALLPLTPERAGVAWGRIKEAEAFLAHVKRAVLATLEEAGGELPLPDGRRLVRRTAPGNERLEGPTAFAVLAEFHGSEVARAAVEMEVTKAGIRDALRPVSAKHGDLGRHEKAALAAIRERGGAARAKDKVVIEEIEGEVTP